MRLPWCDWVAGWCAALFSGTPWYGVATSFWRGDRMEALDALVAPSNFVSASLCASSSIDGPPLVRIVATWLPILLSMVSDRCWVRLSIKIGLAIELVCRFLRRPHAVALIVASAVALLLALGASAGEALRDWFWENLMAILIALSWVAMVLFSSARRIMEAPLNTARAELISMGATLERLMVEHRAADGVAETQAHHRLVHQEAIEGGPGGTGLAAIWEQLARLEAELRRAEHESEQAAEKARLLALQELAALCPAHAFEDQSAAQGNAELESCGICLEPMKPTDPVRLLPCGHSAFHASCLEEYLAAWVSRSTTTAGFACPMCRHPVFAGVARGE